MSQKIESLPITTPAPEPVQGDVAAAGRKHSTAKLAPASADTPAPSERNASQPGSASKTIPGTAADQSNENERVMLASKGPNDMPAYEAIALVLQGGGALGAYQAGVFEGLHEAGIVPGHLAGISIGALNIAIIAGNAPENRVQRLREFWETICAPNGSLGLAPFFERSVFGINDTSRQYLSAMHAFNALTLGQNGFFKPRFPPPSSFLDGEVADSSYYDTSALKATLERLCDFDRINDGKQRVSVGAVNVRNGNFVYFDNQSTTLRAEHFMASGALPPAFPAVEIDGEYYWDGGLVSNTPLSQVLDSRPLLDTLVFQVDLWSSQGKLPTNMGEVSDRINDIRYSSRTRLITDDLRWSQYLRHILQRLLEKIPEDQRDDDAYCRMAQDLACNKRYNVIHLIYRNQPYERHYKDYQFGMSTMHEHWAGGLEDIRTTLLDPRRLAMPQNASGFVTHDIHREEIERMHENTAGNSGRIK